MNVIKSLVLLNLQRNLLQNGGKSEIVISSSGMFLKTQHSDGLQEGKGADWVVLTWSRSSSRSSRTLLFCMCNTCRAMFSEEKYPKLLALGGLLRLHLLGLFVNCFFFVPA